MSNKNKATANKQSAINKQSSTTKQPATNKQLSLQNVTAPKNKLNPNKNTTTAKGLLDAAALNKKLSLIQNILFVLAMIVVFYPVFLRGLFFETNQLWTEIIVFILFTIFATIKYLKKEKLVFNTLLDYASLAFVVVYALSMISAVYLRDALSEWLKYCMYFALFFMLSDMLLKEKNRIRMLWTIAASGTGVALIGMDAAAGAKLSGLLNKLANLLGYKYELFFKLYEGKAVNSTLQYPNAAAAYFVAIFIVLMGLGLISEKTWQKLLAGAMGFLVLETFILTLSKGGYLTMAVAALIFIIVLPKKTRGTGLVDLLAHFAVAAALHHYMEVFVSESRHTDLALLLLAGLAATLILDAIICRTEKHLENIPGKFYAAAFAMLAIISVAGIWLLSAKTDILPGNIFSSIGSFFKSTSVTARMAFYKDGLKAIGQRPLLGFGGGSWQYVYQQYQSYLYWTTLPHNFPLQLGVESGIVGILAFLAMLAGTAIYYIKYRKKEGMPLVDRLMAATAITAIAAILGHSMIDFDLSLSAIFLLLWELLAILNALFKSEGLILRKKAISTENKAFALRNGVIAILAIILAAALVIIPCTLKSAELKAADANASFTAGERSKAISTMKSAMSQDTLNAAYKIDYANMATNVTYTNTDLLAINKIADKAYVQANYNPDLVAKLYQFYMYTGNYNKGLDAANRVTQLRPFWPNALAAKTNALFQIGIYLFSKMDNENALKYMQYTVDVMDEMKEVNKKNTEPSIMSEDTMTLIEKAKYAIDSIEVGKTIDIDKVVFYYVPGMDADRNDIPDQWNLNAQENVSISERDDMLVVSDSNPDPYNYIETRTLSFETNSEYKVTVELEKGTIAESLIHATPSTTIDLKFIEEGNVFTGTFVTEQTVGTNRGLIIYISDILTIKSVVIEKIG